MDVGSTAAGGQACGGGGGGGGGDGGGGGGHGSNRLRLIVDTDGGIDDLMALALALRCPDMVELVAVATVRAPLPTKAVPLTHVQVCGNVPVDKATANVQLLFHFMQQQESGSQLHFPPILAMGASKPMCRLLTTAEYFRATRIL